MTGREEDSVMLNQSQLGFIGSGRVNIYRSIPQALIRCNLTRIVIATQSSYSVREIGEKYIKKLQATVFTEH
jgi:hypothetical protein